MEPIGFHVNFRLADARVIAPTTSSQRAAARAVLSAARPYELLGFRVADTHLHLLAVGGRSELTELVRRVKIALHQQLSLKVPFGQAHYEAVHSQGHLERAFWYVLRQDQHHGFQHDPLQEASNLPDLLGLRLLGLWTTVPARRHLPRVDRGRLLACLGRETLEPEPTRDLSLLPEAAAAAIGRDALLGREPDVVAARAAAVHLALELGSAVDCADRLGISARTVRRLHERAPEPRMVRAVALQVALRQGVEHRVGVDGELSPALL